MKANARSGVVLFMTHFWDDACTTQMTKLRRELGAHYDIKVVGHVPADKPHPAVPDDVPAFFFNESELTVFGEDQPEVYLHHFVVPRFFMAFPDYAHYWVIEYDVRYTGHWGKLFATLNDPDVAFYGIGMMRQSSHPEWSHWRGFSTGNDDVAAKEFVKCFGPMQRLSAPALAIIQTSLSHGWRGHYEALWPTAIAHAGLRLEEIGAKGEFTPKSRRGLHYTNTPLDPNGSPGSFVYRPTFEEHQIRRWPPRLWHPVKRADMQQPRMYDTPMPAPRGLARLWRRL